MYSHNRNNNVYNIDDQIPEQQNNRNYRSYNGLSDLTNQSLNRMDEILNLPDEENFSVNSSGLSHRHFNGSEHVRDYTPSRLQKVLSGDTQMYTIEDEIDQITKQIEKKEHLMEDTKYAEQARFETLRDMPHSLTVKREIKNRLNRQMRRRSSARKINNFKHMQYSIGLALKQVRNGIKNLLTNTEIWYDSLKIIEGHFGSSVAAYFKFLRWLFVLNLLLLIVTIGFIIIPQILYNSTSNDNTAVSDENYSTNKTSEFNFLDILTGEGFLENTILFYGAYSNSTLNPNTTPYNIPTAYFTTMICLYVATFTIVSISMARSYRKSFIESYGGLKNFYSHKIFCSWDFGISIKKAADLKQKSIYNEIKEMLSESERDKEKLTKWKYFYDKAVQASAHFLVFALLAGLAIGMWALLQEFGKTEEMTPWTALYLSITVNATILILQLVFSWISFMEEYKSRRTTVHMNLFRNFLLELVIITVLLVFWLSRKEIQEQCWETSIGQEIYRLVLVDFLITIVGIFIFQSIRKFIHKKWKKIGLSEFNISTGTLTLIFNQILLWVGLLFSPLLATIIIIKLIIIFYLKKFSLIYLCEAPTHLWRSAQTQTLYLVLIFLALLCVVVGHGYIITQVRVSESCGPFRECQYMINIFFNEKIMFWKFLKLITRPAVIGGILLALCVLVYYLRAKSMAKIAMVKLLKEMLVLEARDKEFLLSDIQKITQGKEFLFEETMFGGRDCGNRNTEISNTWHFNRNQSENELKSRPVSGFMNFSNNNNYPQPSTSRHQRLSKEYSMRNRLY